MSKTKQVKAKKMWRLPNNQIAFNPIFAKEPIDGYTEGVFVLPATPEAYEAMVEQGAKAIKAHYRSGLTKWRIHLEMKVLLSSLGIHHPTKKKK